MTSEPQHPPTIEIDGAQLRPLRQADADALYDYLRNPAVTELTSYPDVSVTLVESIIERASRRWAAGELSKWGVALPHDDRLVDTCAPLGGISVRSGAASLGPRIDAPSRGRRASVDFPT